MIFLGGIHGVGKTYLCQKLKDIRNLNSYSASNLIGDLKREWFTSNKKIIEIDQNQNFLIEAVKQLQENRTYLLDGHFCLLDKEGIVTKIPINTFKILAPKSIIIVVNSVEQIAKYLMNRDKSSYDLKFLENFQKRELEYAIEISQLLNIPFFIHSATNELSDLLIHIDQII